MAGKQSWAERRWWRGTVFDWMGVLLLLLLIFVLAFVSVPFLLLRHTVSSGLQDHYLTVYRSTCASWERRTAALPYVLQPNGVRRLASSGDVVVLPPGRAGACASHFRRPRSPAGPKGCSSCACRHGERIRPARSCPGRVRRMRLPTGEASPGGCWYP
jgi:hypothetical protein